MACPNINSSQWKNLVAKIGTFEAFKEFIKNGEKIPDANNYQETFKGTNATLKITQALVNPKIEGFFKNQYLKGNRDKFFNEVAAIAGKQQTNLLREHLKNNTYTSVPEMIAGLLAEMNYTVQINTAKTNEEKQVIQRGDNEEFTFNGFTYEYKNGEYLKDDEIIDLIEYESAKHKAFTQPNAQYYSNLTVPGGTNYTENEIAIPDILVEEPSNVSIKEGVDFVFEQNPELANIGTQQLYSQYLNTIFPESKVKDIVYHGSNTKIEQFEIRKEPLIHFGSKNAALERGDVLHQILLNIENLQSIKDGMWFLGTEQGGLLKELLDKNILTVQEIKSINEIKNKALEQSPYFHENYRMAIPAGEKAGNQKLQEILKNKNIGFEYVNESEDKGSVSYAVPSQEQIHILGSKQDIEGFRKWKKNNLTQKIKKGIVPAIKGHAQFATDNGIGWFRGDDKAFIHKQELEGISAEDYWNLSEEERKIVAKKANDNQDRTKTRRILELQSDLFQKGRGKENLVDTGAVTDLDQIGFYYNGSYYESDAGKYFLKDGKNISFEEFEKAGEDYEKLISKNKENQFLQLLNKDNNWVTFFVKSIIQDSAKKGYEKVLFPKGDTAAKIEGHQTLEEFKKQKEDRIKKLENSRPKIVASDPNYKTGVIGFSIERPDGSGRQGFYDTKEQAEKSLLSFEKDRIREIERLKQELADVESGQTQLSSIANFYENTVANILKKQGYAPTRITDEYGNTWNEINIYQEMTNEPIYIGKDNRASEKQNYITPEGLPNITPTC